MIAGYLFLVGFAGGLALLPVTAYRRVSPPWLRRLLMAVGLGMVARYVALAAFAAAASPEAVWSLRHAWYASAVGLTLPSAFAVDQLVRHPAMTPTKLLRYLSPFLAVYLAVILVAPAAPVPDPLVAGWAVQLAPGWQRLLAVTQAVFVLLFLGVCLQLFRRLPSRPVRVALAGLMLAHLALAADGVLLWLGYQYLRPFLYTEMFTCVALWHAYETAASGPA